jgi:polar amino acid transport system permease protein
MHGPSQLTMSSIDHILSYLTSRAFFNGALMTLFLSAASLLGGMLMGLAVALLQESRFRVLRAIAVVYLLVFRGTPVLFQLIFIFNVLPSFGLVLPGIACAILGLSLNEGAYMGEIMRSGINAVGRGQRLAARALGMKDWQVTAYVVLPQALRIIIPPIGNQFIGMLKMSALVSVIAVNELLLVANQKASAEFRYLEAFAAAGTYYLGMTLLLMLGQSWVERRIRRRGRRAAKVSLIDRLTATANAGQIR